LDALAFKAVILCAWQVWLLLLALSMQLACQHSMQA
jgi:hypothetical protein